MRITMWLAGLCAAVTAGCTGVPKGLEPVRGFELQRYLGTWYEIARLDHRSERGLSDVTAYYFPRADGETGVINRGWKPDPDDLWKTDAPNGRWTQVEGIVRFRGDEDVSSLKLSFFRPFWSGYHVIALDKEGYAWAMVAGPSRSYLWVLSRTPTLDEGTLAHLVAQAAQWGYDTDALIYPMHEWAPGAPWGQSGSGPPSSLYPVHPVHPVHPVGR